MSTWNESLEKGLLIHLLDLDVQIPRARFQAVAEQMGHGLTGEACRTSLQPQLNAVHMPQVWSHEADCKLLLAVLGPDLTVNWYEVATRLGGQSSGGASCQKFYKLKKECEQLKASDGAVGPATPKLKVNGNGSARKPGAGNDQKRKAAAGEDGGSAQKRTKKVTHNVAEDEPEDEPEDESEEDDAQDEGKVSMKEDGDDDEVAV